MAYDALEEASNEYHQPRLASPEPNSKDAAQIRLSTARYEQWLLAMEIYDQKREAAYLRLWYSVQAFLVAAGNISKLLWPPGKPLFPERGPVSAISGLELDDRLRHFDPTTYTVTFRGETYHLRPIIEAVQAIHLRGLEKCRERAWGIPDRIQGPVCHDRTIGTFGTATV